MQVVLHKIPLKERLSKVLQHSPFKLNVTRSALNELKTLAEHCANKDDTKQKALQQARQWGLDECDGILEETDIPKSDCDNDESNTIDVGLVGKEIIRLVRSEETYFIATQDEILLDSLRHMGRSPLLRLSRGVLLLEQPSKVAQQRASLRERHKYRNSIPSQERALVQHVRQEIRLSNTAQHSSQQQPRRKRKAKGPNPLSCKKKSAETQSEPRKRNRRRKDTANQQSGNDEATL